MSEAESPPSGGSASQTFAAIWDALVDVLGSAAAATLVRRAISEARSAAPGLDELEVSRVGFEYRYVVPASWRTPSAVADDELRTLTGRLEPLLRELTGPVVLKRLRALPDVARSELFKSEVEQ